MNIKIQVRFILLKRTCDAYSERRREEAGERRGREREREKSVHLQREVVVKV